MLCSSREKRSIACRLSMAVLLGSTSALPLAGRGLRRPL